MKEKMLFVIIIILCFASSCTLFHPQPGKVFAENKVNGPYDAIIVPGVPYNGEHWSGTMKIRVHWSNYLYNKGYVKNVIYSGDAVYSPYTEAKVMALYGKALGIPEEHVFVDSTARHSTENLYYCYQIAKEQGFEKVALGTDPYQTNNLRKFIKKYELPITLLPIVIDTMIVIDKYEPEIDPRSAKKAGFVSIEESESLIYRLKGTMGQQIIWRKEDLKKKRFIRRFRRQGRLIE